MLVKWGKVGFSLNVKKEDVNIPVLFGYAPDAIHGQSVLTSFYGQGCILKKLKCGESVISELVTDDFADIFTIRSGNDYKVSIDDSFSDEQEKRLFLWLERMVDFIVKTPLK